MGGPSRKIRARWAERIAPPSAAARPLAANTQTLNQGFVPLRISAFQVIKQPASARNHRKKPAPAVVIFFVRLEMLRQLQNLLTQDRYLYLWRTSIRLVDLVFRNRILLNFTRQCHSRIDTPRLLPLIFVSIISIA
jgi:hypothetical protein